jgi:hypothetical protein
MKVISLIATAIGISICCMGVTLGNIYNSPLMTFAVGILGGAVAIVWALIFYWEMKHGN